MVSFLHYWYYELYDSAHAWYRGLRHNPRWLLMRQLSRFALIRACVKRFQVRRNSDGASYRMSSGNFSGCRPGSSGDDRPSYSVLANASLDQVVRSIQQDGYFLGLQLSSPTVEAILDFAEQHPCLGNRYPHTGFYYAEKQQAEAYFQTAFVTASYFNTASSCAAIAQLGQDPVLRSIAAAYLGREPVLISSRLWWSFPSAATMRDRRKSAQMFHYDRDDFVLLKFFFYLTDVDEGAGPHVCVRGTHRQKRWRHEWFGKQFSETLMVRSYGAANVVTICGRAGSGFAEDTFCFHRAVPPQQRDRLILQLEYALTDYGMERDTIDPTRVQVYTARSNSPGRASPHRTGAIRLL
ncbi:hypothetical protein [Leptolyngbya ohadii]|uniref:hypothetical protein n=1 Tax=Leptolyngbya ohadii TaxID=1962290 RepID=UPI000B59F803|nr:hypothetical protein [Leptolyngbya ohadii]